MRVCVTDRFSFLYVSLSIRPYTNFTVVYVKESLTPTLYSLSSAV